MESIVLTGYLGWCLWWFFRRKPAWGLDPDEIDRLAVIPLALFGIIELILQVITLATGNSQLALNRVFGPYWLAFWLGLLVIGMLPQLLWLGRIRRSRIFRIIHFALIVIYGLGMGCLSDLFAGANWKIESGWAWGQVLLTILLALGGYAAYVSAAAYFRSFRKA